MIVGIMQPYFFPYIGYFQLIAACDCFVFHDDVQYIKGGWINRNRIVQNGKASWLTFPVAKSGHDRRINERRYCGDSRTTSRLLRRIAAGYRGAPRFREIYPLIDAMIGFPEENVAAFNIRLIRRLAEHFGISRRFVRSSELAKNDALAGEERVIAICRALGATQYLNPIGGEALYHPERFGRAGLRLGFLEPGGCRQALNQSGAPVPLSIIDHLMCEDRESLAASLARYRILDR